MEKSKSQNTIIAAIIGATATICAAIIMLGTPLVELWAKSWLITPTAIALSPTPDFISSSPSLNLPKSTEIFPGKPKKAYTINPNYPNDRTVDVIDLFVQCLSCNEQDIQITSGDGSYDYPSWSPDGTMIAVLKGPDCWNEQLVIIASDGSWQKAIEGVTPMCRDISWSVVGNEIAYNDISGSLMAINLQSGEIRTIVRSTEIQNTSEDIMDISWSPDGKKLTFWTRLGSNPNEETGWQIWVVNADGSNLINLRESEDGYGQSSVNWSIDGQLVYTRFEMLGNDERGPHEGRVMNSDGSDRKEIQGTILIRTESYYPSTRYCGGWFCGDYTWNRD